MTKRYFSAKDPVLIKLLRPQKKRGKLLKSL